MKKLLLQQAWCRFRKTTILNSLCLMLGIVAGCASTGDQQQGAEPQQGQAESASNQDEQAQNQMAGNEMASANGNANKVEGENIEGGADGNFAAGNVGTSEGNDELSTSINNVVSDDASSGSLNNGAVANSPSPNTAGTQALPSNLPPLNQVAPLPNAANGADHRLPIERKAEA